MQSPDRGLLQRKRSIGGQQGGDMRTYAPELVWDEIIAELSWFISLVSLPLRLSSRPLAD